MRPCCQPCFSATAMLAVATFMTTGCGLVRTSGYEDLVAPVEPVARSTATRDGQQAAGDAAERESGRTGSGPLEIGVTNAILLALENNRGFTLQKLGPEKHATFEEEAAAAFDPSVTASFSNTRTDNAGGSGAVSTTESASVGASVLLPTGTQIGLEAEHGLVDPGATADTNDARVDLSVSQPVLRGGSRAANLASIRQAAIETRVSEYELRGLAEALVAQVETAYWDYALAGKRIAIFEESLRLAERQLRETNVRIDAGKLAGTDRAAARAEVETRNEALVTARGDLDTARIRLLRLLNPPGQGSENPGFWAREVKLRDDPIAPEGEPGDVEAHVRTALRRRPDLNQARLGVERGDLEVVRTRNGLLPRLDLFINLGRTGYADSFSAAAGDLDESYDVTAGISFEYVLGNRSARARHRRAELSREEAALAVGNLAELVQVDVRTAHIAATTAGKRIAATSATRLAKEEALRAETEKFRVGRSTTFQVAQAQRDLVSSRISEVEAVVGCVKALVELYEIDGSILDRRGIRAPGLPTE